MPIDAIKINIEPLIIKNLTIYIVFNEKDCNNYQGKGS